VNRVETLKTKIKQPSPPNWHQYWIFRIVLVLSLSLLLYSGYCFGLWGRKSLLLQYLFQCNCPSLSAEWRYPRQVDIIVPACSYLGSMLSPTGNLLYVIEGESRFADTFSSTYLLDFRTNEKIPFFIGKGSHSFLTDDLLLLSLYYGQEGYEGGDYISDRTTGKQYPIQRFRSLRKDAYINSQPNLEVLAIELRDAQDVYLIDDDTIVALRSNFQTSPERNFYIDQKDLSGRDPNRAQQFLQQNDIDYHAVPGSFQKEAESPDGRFIARADGIYLAESGEKIVEVYTVRGIIGEYFSVQGWISDSSGVIYYIIDNCLFRLSSWYCNITVPQPLIKLKVPEVYLLSNEEK
jgi:hypothetical protein